MSLVDGVAVQAEDISVTIGKQKILRDITLTIPSGSITGLLGPSGAGKTTFMRALVGLQHLSHGSLSVFGQTPGSKGLRSQIGYMTQNLSIYADLTVLENLQYFAKINGAHAGAIPEILKRLQLQRQTNQLVEKLSGGQKTRVSLGAALLGKPRLFILDEPTVGIDPLLRAEIWVFLKELAAGGATLLVSSHVMEEAEHCGQIMLMRDGRVLAYDSPKSLKHQTGTHDIESAFLSLVGSHR